MGVPPKIGRLTIYGGELTGMVYCELLNQNRLSVVSLSTVLMQRS